MEEELWPQVHPDLSHPLTSSLNLTSLSYANLFSCPHFSLTQPSLTHTSPYPTLPLTLTLTQGLRQMLLRERMRVLDVFRHWEGTVDAEEASHIYGLYSSIWAPIYGLYSYIWAILLLPHRLFLTPTPTHPTPPTAPTPPAWSPLRWRSPPPPSNPNPNPKPQPQLQPQP